MKGFVEKLKSTFTTRKAANEPAIVDHPNFWMHS